MSLIDRSREWEYPWDKPERPQQVTNIKDLQEQFSRTVHGKTHEVTSDGKRVTASIDVPGFCEENEGSSIEVDQKSVVVRWNHRGLRLVTVGFPNDIDVDSVVATILDGVMTLIADVASGRKRIKLTAHAR